MYKNNTSGIKGIFWNTREGKWMVRIQVDWQQKHIGSFSDILEAAYHRYAVEQCLGYQDCDINSSAKRFIDEHEVVNGR